MKQKLLLVDDSFYMRTMLKNILSDAGYSIVGEASDGETAIKMALDSDADLMTLDLILPDLTGLDILKRVKAEKPNLRIIIVSAIGQDAIVNEAMNSGASAYIVKPFKEEKVLEVIESVLSPVQE
jgi:two-component system chemotaxis response regulator CheY